MSRIIGIDLGTTTSEIAYIRNGKPEIIVNDFGHRVTPSVVGLTDDDEIVVGILSKRQSILKPERTVLDIKRKMGTQERVKMGSKEYSPQEISAMLLKKMKDFAEDFLGEEVSEAVITVPANFDDLQRKATKEAGELAGFKVERIINEPTAAALAYGIDNLEGEEKVLVYDLGGGTFDVTVLEMFEGILDVKASRGNNSLGGKDFDEAIEKFILEDFKKVHGMDLSNNQKAVARIRDAAEKAKIELSSLSSTDIELPFIAMDKNHNPLEVNVRLTRSKFENLIEDLVNSTMIEINEALNAAGYTTNNIDVVLPIGGSSRLPCVKKLLVDKFPNKIKTEINPDEAVALGAAIQAGIKNDEIDSSNSILITDVCRYTLGTSIISDNGSGRIVAGLFDPLIMRDSSIPCTRKKTYITAEDNQSAVNIEVYQGDGKFVIENTKIAEFELTGVPLAPAGKEAIEISFSYNLNGILEVTAVILSTGKYIKEIVDIQSWSFEETMFMDDINLESWSEYVLSEQISSLVHICEKKIESMDDNDEKEKVQMILSDLKRAVINNDDKLVHEYDNKLTDLLFELD